jgi:adenylate cyclase
MKYLFLKYHLLLVLFSFQIKGTIAQSPASDSLLIMDSFLVNELLQKNDIKSAETALRLAKDIDFKEGQKQAVVQLTQLHKNAGNVSLSLRYALKNLNLLSENAPSTERFAVLETIGNIYFAENLFENALTYYRNAAQLLIKDYGKKVPLLEKIGQSYQQNFELDSALIFYQNAVYLHELEKNYEGQIRGCKAIANIYEEQQNCEKTLAENFKIKQLIALTPNSHLLGTTVNNIGYSYHCLNDFENAIVHFKQAEAICALENCDIDTIALQSNLSIAYFNLGNFNNGKKHLDKAIKLAKEANNQERIAALTHLKATIYFRKKDLYQAQIFNNDAIALGRKGNYAEVLQDSYQLAAWINQELYEFEIALDFYEQHLSLKDSLLLEERLRQQDLLQQKFLLERSEKEIKLLLVNQEIQDLNIRELEKQQDILRLRSEKISLESNRKENELSLLRNEQEIKEERLKTQELEAARARQQLQLTRQQLEAAEKDRSIAELRQNEEKQQREIAEKEAEERRQQSEIQGLKDKQEIDRLQINQAQTINRVFFGTGLGLLGITGVVLFSFLSTRKKSRKLAQQNKEIEAQKSEIEKNRDLVEKERAKSENLLLNILPAETAKELKENGFATPQLYENVSVLFTDFVGFTHIAENMPPAEVISELNTCFLAFDEIIERHHLEKIKTIGDAYMCAGGVPKKDEKSATNAVAAALEMQIFISKRFAQKTAENKPYWTMRVGIHTGSVVAGVVGSKKFAYDIWGDTVNLASRMEQSAKAGKVNISAATYQLVHAEFPCAYRGLFEVKNRGEVEMYFVEDCD